LADSRIFLYSLKILTEQMNRVIMKKKQREGIFLKPINEEIREE